MPLTPDLHSSRSDRAQVSAHPAFLFLWIALFAVFLWPLLTLQKSFIIADFFDQHLPWAHVYASAIRQGHWPFWTSGMACGFPLAAEGQIGVFYLGNILGYRLLPFITAYTLSIPLHLALGSAGMFWYVRRLGVGREGGWLAAALFAFGSSYGGCQYNAGSLRVLTWLPWMLGICEKVRRSTASVQWAGFGGVALMSGLQGTAGASQIAIYSAVYLAAHECIAALDTARSGVLSRARRLLSVAERGTWTAAALALGFLIALPQWSLTAELVPLSVRAGQPLSFALWGAAPILFPVSLLFPSWGNAMGVSFYLGLLPVYWITAACWFERAASVRRHAWLALLFGSFALGGLNPIYRFGVEWSGLTGMRVPSKWLMLCGFSLIVLAAWGWDRLSRTADPAFVKRCRLLPLAALLLPLAGWLAVRIGRPLWQVFSEWYVRGLVAERGARAKSPEYYLNGMNAFFDRLPELFSFRDPAVIHAIIFSFLGFAVLLVWLSRDRHHGVMKTLLAAVLFADLCLFGFSRGIGFIGHAQPIARLTPDAALEKMIAHVAEHGGGNWVEYAPQGASDRLPPNSGMYYGLSHAGAYTPLLLRAYDDLTRDLGIADASLGRTGATLEAWKRQRGVLDLLGARWIRASEALKLDGLDLVLQVGEDRLYENVRAVPAITGVFRFKVIEDSDARTAYLKSTSFDPRREAVLSAALSAPLSVSDRPDAAVGRTILDENGRQEFEIRMDAEGIALIRTSAYPGWSVKIDGRPSEWFTTNHAFMGVRLNPGTHRILLNYRPTHWRAAVMGSAAGTSAALICLIGGLIRSRSRRRSGTAV